jgi:transposase-like protein
MPKKARRGPKPEYNPEQHLIAVKWIARAGMTDADIARALEISPRTLYKWYKAHPELREAKREGAVLADHRVTDSLYKRAVGFNFTETHVSQETDELTGKVVKRKVTKIVKHMPPDVEAIKFWLINRAPSEWRAKVEAIDSADDALLAVLNAAWEYEREEQQAIKNMQREPAAKEPAKPIRH